jgi:hypothetical protein
MNKNIFLWGILLLFMGCNAQSQLPEMKPSKNGIILTFKKLEQHQIDGIYAASISKEDSMTVNYFYNLEIENVEIDSLCIPLGKYVPDKVSYSDLTEFDNFGKMTGHSSPYFSCDSIAVIGKGGKKNFVTGLMTRNKESYCQLDYNFYALQSGKYHRFRTSAFVHINNHNVTMLDTIIAK